MMNTGSLSTHTASIFTMFGWLNFLQKQHSHVINKYTLRFFIVLLVLLRYHIPFMYVHVLHRFLYYYRH